MVTNQEEERERE